MLVARMKRIDWKFYCLPIIAVIIVYNYDFGNREVIKTVTLDNGTIYKVVAYRKYYGDVKDVLFTDRLDRELLDVKIDDSMFRVRYGASKNASLFTRVKVWILNEFRMSYWASEDGANWLVDMWKQYMYQREVIALDSSYWTVGVDIYKNGSLLIMPGPVSNAIFQGILKSDQQYLTMASDGLTGCYDIGNWFYVENIGDKDHLIIGGYFVTVDGLKFENVIGGRGDVDIRSSQ